MAFVTDIMNRNSAKIGTTTGMHYYGKSYPELELKETFARRFKTNYQIQLKTVMEEVSENSTVQELVPKKRGQPLLIGEELDEQIRKYVRELPLLTAQLLFLSWLFHITIRVY